MNLVDALSVAGSAACVFGAYYLGAVRARRKITRETAPVLAPDPPKVLTLDDAFVWSGEVPINDRSHITVTIDDQPVLDYIHTIGSLTGCEQVIEFGIRNARPGSTHAERKIVKPGQFTDGWRQYKG